MKNGSFTCFLSEDTRLPLMFMDDCVGATIRIMQAPKEDIKIRTAYNLKGFSCTPRELERELKKHIPAFKVAYAPD
ncbi:MAG: NAD-dependent epimerase, partial [Actinomycetota bacterium]